jgi:hypothetical protein
MDSTERDNRTTVHPVAYTVKKEEPRENSLDVAKRMSLIAVISGGVAMLIRRTLYPKLLDLQPKNLPVALPSDFGFFAAGWGVTTATIVARKNSITRRSFFYPLAAGLGAVIGAKMVGEADRGDVQTENPNNELRGSSDEMNDEADGESASLPEPSIR